MLRNKQLQALVVDHQAHLPLWLPKLLVSRGQVALALGPPVCVHAGSRLMDSTSLGEAFLMENHRNDEE